MATKTRIEWKLQRVSKELTALEREAGLEPLPPLRAAPGASARDRWEARCDRSVVRAQRLQQHYRAAKADA